MKTAALPAHKAVSTRKCLTLNVGSCSARQTASDNLGEDLRVASWSEKPGIVPPPFPAGNDRFHHNSLVAQVWLVQLQNYTQRRYGEAKGVSKGLVQTGHGWRSFSRLFEPLSALELIRLFENLLRFANYGADLPARSFFLAYAPLSFEHDASGQYIGPGVWTPVAGSNDAFLRVRRTLKRWCEWLEALTHCQIHELSHAEPAYQQLDRTIIFLWPLLRYHNWSYRDLANVLRSLEPSVDCFPCRSERQLATYCRTALRLRRGSFGARIDGPLPGETVARRLVGFLPAIG